MKGAWICKCVHFAGPIDVGVQDIQGESED
jgi:hypothetical protein